MKIKCAHCGEAHDISATAWGFNEPHQWQLITEKERKKSELTPDCCLIESADGNSYYIRGEMLLPIRKRKQPLTLGVWSSLSKTSMREIMKTWNDPSRVEKGPYFGWLSNALPFVPDSMYLKVNVIQRKPGVRPLIELQKCDHPLAKYQREGISAAELQTLTAALLHSS